MATTDAEQTCEESVSKEKQEVEEGAGDDQDEDCSICWCRVRERPSTTLVCNHIFHLDCIGSEFNIMGCMQCPTCRQVDPVGNWRFWGNELSANVLLRRVKRSSALLQPDSLSSGDLANVSVSPQGLHFHNGGEFGHDLPRRPEDFVNWYWSRASQGLPFSTDGVGWYPPGSELSGLQDPVQGLDPARTTSLYGNSLDWLSFPFNVNRSTTIRQGSCMNQRCAYDMVSRLVQGQHAANLHAATGSALHGTARYETQGVYMAAEGQRERRRREVLYDPELALQGRVRREALASHMRHGESAAQLSVDAEGPALAARVNHGIHDSERIGHEIQAMNMARGEFEEEPPVLDARVRHGSQQMSASRSRASEH